MISNNKVSIVLPVHNGERFLARSIESCIAQTYADWELIVVDDASADRSAAIAEEFARKDPRISVIRHANNIKLPAALNSGFAKASGQYLTWTSDDNLYRPDALASMVEYLRANPDVGLVYCDCTLIDEQDQLIRERVVPEWDLAVELNPVGACFMYRREVMEVVGKYREDLFLCEDYDYWLRISARYPVRPLHQSLYLYRHHDRSLTATRQREIQQALHRTLRRNLPALKYLGAAKKAETYYVMAGRAWHRREWIEIVVCVWLSMMNSPGWFVGRLMGKMGR